MKRIAVILLTLSSFAAQFANAQTCPASATYSNQSGTFDLSAGKSIVLNNGGFYQITIQNNFSSTSSICILNGSHLTLNFQNVNSMGKGGFINVDKFATLTINGSGINNFPLTINNNGITTQATNITYSDGATINNTGSYYINSAATLNSGTVAFTNSGYLGLTASLNYNNGSFSMSNAASSTIAFSTALTLSSTTINNSGTINYAAAVTLQSSSVVSNKGFMFMSSDLSFSGATFNNSGILSVPGSTNINSGSVFNNYCTVSQGLNFSNNGTVNNTGNIILGGTLTNQGLFTNGSTSQVQGTNFTNNGTVTGSGKFLFFGTTINQGPFNGTSASSKINFYDGTLFSSKYFDVQNTTPTNISKNLVFAIVANLLTPCADVSAPIITAQPSTQTFCSIATTSATYSVAATSSSALSYQWYKNGTAISGATASSYTASGLTLADTANAYTVRVANPYGTITSNSASVKYIIVTQPTPLTQVIATGNTANFSLKTSGATSLLWQKNGIDIPGAALLNYALSLVNYADSGSYKALVTYSGGVCTSDAAVLKTSVILYSKSTGNLNQPATWGVATDGTGSTPVDFTRDEHTFIVANRASIATGADVTIAGKLDVANGNVTITPGTTLTAGRIVRSLTSGVLIGSSTSNLSLTGIATAAYAGASDLYFDAANNILKNLTVAAHTVTLRTALNITAGSAAGVVKVNSGTLATSDILTLKSDVNGTGSIGSSAGTIIGKVTIEKYIHARRAWRLMGAPITSTNAPSINAAWQEGATSSTANPNPGFGTHITYGLVSDGFDQNPQKSFSMKVRNASGSWVGVPSTKTTTITNYPAYFIFIRGNRSYNILGTTDATTPTTTILRVTGNVNQGTQAATAVSATGFTLVSNPYAAPINFTKLLSSNIKPRIRVWDPTLAGAKGVGGYVVLDGSTGAYKATPPSANVSTLLQAGQGFFVESNDGVKAGSITFAESAKDLTGATLGADRVGAASIDTSLEINLKLFNADSTTAIADGVLFNFNAAFNDSVDNDDATKLYNFSENLSIKESNTALTIDNRTMPKENDSLRLSLLYAKNASYQFEFVPSSVSNQAFALYDKYLNSFSPISSNDTTRITFSVNTAVDASKATDRFTIVVLKSKVKSTVLANKGITSIKASAKDKTISVEWTVSNEQGMAYYEVQKSADGNTFAAAGNVIANASAAYSFTDATPAAGINYYRIKSVSKNGSIVYTNIVNAQLQTISASGVSSVGVYPNPLTGSTFTLTLSNMAAGSYTLSVINSNGAAQFSQAIAHNGGTASQKISLSHSLAAGIYYVKVAAANGTANMVKIIAQ